MIVFSNLILDLTDNCFISDVWLDFPQQRRILDQLCRYWPFLFYCQKTSRWSQSFYFKFKCESIIIQNSFRTEMDWGQVEQKIFSLQSVYSNINRILSDAGALIESQHYASPHLRTVASHLEKAWKDFATGLDERTTVLALSVMFHQKAEQVNIVVLNNKLCNSNLQTLDILVPW